MRLRHLAQALPTILGWVGGDAEIHGIVADSRQVQPGVLFVAIPGVSVDGHRFIAQAVAEGAIAVVGEHPPQELPTDVLHPHLPWGSFTYVRVPDARQAWGWLCAAWHDFPSRRMTLVGVTGTDGKTTTVNLIYTMLRAAGLNAGMVSTVNARIGEQELDTGLHTTTPDPPDVQRYLADMVETGATHAVLEVTSHGLAQYRVAGCDFDVAAVTNVTHEHTDFHGTVEAYRQAKARLFEGLAHSFRKPGVPKVAVLNRDDDSYHYLSSFEADRQITYGTPGYPPPVIPSEDGCTHPRNPQADVTARDVRTASGGTSFTLCLPGADGVHPEEIQVETALPGAFNVSNVLAAAAVGVALDLGPEAIATGASTMRQVPGRMERVDAGQSFVAIVDFAHTPNALQRALQTAARLAEEGSSAPKARVIVVFGCAGLRDRAKRAMMGHIAGQLADLVIVTAEDPRTENLDDILAEIAVASAGSGKREGVDLFRVPDRGEAILLACQQARAGDVVIACGKGHEQSMCFGTTEYPWDDREALRRALRGQTLDTLPTAAAKRP